MPTPTFKPIGPAPIQDPFVPRLNRADPWGSGTATGAINSLEIVQDDITKDAVLFAGSVNGGVWSREYNGAEDTWNQWKQISSYSDYRGVQSISKLKATEDGTLLIAAAGTPSSWLGLSGDIQDPLQFAVLAANGSVDFWLGNDPNVQRILRGQAVTALEETDNIVLIGTNQGLYVGQINGTLNTVVEVAVNNALSQLTGYTVTSIAKGSSGRIYAAINAPDVNGGTVGAVLTTTVEALRTTPSAAWDIIDGSMQRSMDKSTLRLSTTKDPQSGKDILYLGTASNNPQAYDYIHKLQYDESGASQAWVSKLVSGQIGDNQAITHSSFAADPTDPNIVYAGGNILTSYPNAYTGGLVAVSFDGEDATFTEHFASLERPYNAGGTAPHADSRDIAFLATRTGSTRIIEASDGGIAIKDADLEAPWQFYLNEGLRTIESLASDWSNIGNLAITAMQDNALSIAKYQSFPTWLNVTGGDGAHARFDDARKDNSTGLAHAYYGSQRYSSNGFIEMAGYDESGTLRYTDRLELEVLDGFENPQDFLNYDMIPTNAQNYDFYLPFETNPYRAGDVVLAGQRNLYEQIVPHWKLKTAGEMLLLPVIDDLEDPSDSRRRLFTAVEIGSKRGETLSTTKPKSWDALYTGFFEINQDERSTHFYGRNAGETTEELGDNKDWPNNFKLKDLTSYLPEQAKNRAITGISINPNNTNQIWATIASDHAIYRTFAFSPSEFNQPSYLIYSSNGGIDWEIAAESGDSGIPSNAQLQQVIYISSKNGEPSELYVSGYGGVWYSTLDDDGKPGSFQSVNWSGRDINPTPSNQDPLSDKDNADFNYWVTNLEYDPVDDVVIASTMGQGAWLLNRSALEEAPAAEPGFKISPIWLPQDNILLRRKKTRSIEGVLSVSLERTDNNIDQDVSVELVLPDDWSKYITLQANNQPQLDGIVGKNRIKLDFPVGINELRIYVNNVLQGITLPDIILEARLENPVNADITSDSSSAQIYLFANGETISMRQEATGVLYSHSTVLERHYKLPNQAQKIAVLMPRANLNKGDQLFWFNVNSDGSVNDGDNAIMPSDERYLEAVKRQLNIFQLISTSTYAYDPRAFSPDKAAQAFNNPSVVLSSEGIAIGDLISAASSGLPSQDRFALALRDSTGNIRVSTQGLKLDPDPLLDNAVTIGNSPETGSQLVLAPAEGELFVADINFIPVSTTEPAATTEYSLEVARFSNFNSGYGIFRVDDPFGNFLFVDGSRLETPIQQGTLEYAKEALKRSASNGVDGITGLPIPGYAQSNMQTISLATGNYYGLYITPDKILDTADELNDLSQIFFSIKNANQNQQLQHVSMGTGYFSFEDTGFAGDRDFNDMVFAITPLNISPIA